MNPTETTRIPRAARALGWLGVVPFAALTVASLMRIGLPPEAARQALADYAMVILAFMAGVQWGLAMMRVPAARWGGLAGYGVSVLPALLAFASRGFETGVALGLLAAGFVALLIYDALTVRAGEAPPWYLRLRVELSSSVVVLLAIAALTGAVEGE